MGGAWPNSSKRCSRSFCANSCGSRGKELVHVWLHYALFLVSTTGGWTCQELCGHQFSAHTHARARTHTPTSTHTYTLYDTSYQKFFAWPLRRCPAAQACTQMRDSACVSPRTAAQMLKHSPRQGCRRKIPGGPTLIARARHHGHHRNVERVADETRQHIEELRKVQHAVWMACLVIDKGL